MTALVVAEHEAGALKAAVFNTVAAAVLLGGPVHVLVAGTGAAAAADAAARIAGVSKALIVDDPAIADQSAEPVAALIAALAGDYAAVLASASSFGKAVLPRAAALLNVQPISDVTAVVAPDVFVRPIYAGAALATVRSADRVKLLTVRAAAFAAAAPEGGSGETAALALPAGVAAAAGTSRFIDRRIAASERPDLTAARVVISGGRGMGSGENFALLEKIADKLGAAVGASRAAVDAGFVSNDLQIGQTGKIVAPELYIAVGISGAVQHLAGMKDSKIIVAINKDEEAPIFQVADYGLVADLFKAAPELEAALSAD